MPFKSEKQRAYMFATHPKMAKKFQAETPKEVKLPTYSKLSGKLDIFKKAKKLY